MSNSNFSKLTNEDLTSLQLQSILKERHPKSGMILNVIHLIKNKKLSVKVKTDIYAYGWNSLEDSSDSFIVIIQTFQYFEDVLVLLSTPDLSNGCNNVKNFMEKALGNFEKLIDWKHPHCFGEVDPDVMPKLLEMCTRNKSDGLSIEPEIYTFWYSDSSQSSLENDSVENKDYFQSSDDKILVKPLNRSDAEKVDKCWKESRPGTLEFFQDSIDTIASAGVYLKNELISWGVTTPASSINAVNTIDEYRKRGFAELAMKALVEENCRLGLISLAHVDPKNEPSLNLMRKVGLKHSHDCGWLIYSRGVK